MRAMGRAWGEWCFREAVGVKDRAGYVDTFSFVALNVGSWTYGRTDHPEDDGGRRRTGARRGERSRVREQAKL